MMGAAAIDKDAVAAAVVNTERCTVKTQLGMVPGDVLLPAAGKGELQPAVRRAADVDAARAHAVMVIGGKGRRLLAHQQHKRDPPRKAVSEAVPLLQGLIRVGYARMAQAGGAGAGKMPAARRR